MLRKSVIWLAVGLFWWPVPSGAQPQTAGMDPAEIEALFNANVGAGEFRAVKERIQFLLKQNKILEAQYAALGEQVSGLQEKMRRSRKEIAALEQDQIRREQERRQKFDDMLARAKEDTGPIKGLSQLQLYDLQCQKKELELALQLKAAAPREKQQAYDRQLADLQKQLDESREQEKQLAAQVEDWERKSAAASVEFDLLKQQNAHLEDQNKAALEARELSKKKEAAQAGLAKQVRLKEKQKAQLARDIEKLTAQIGSSVEGSVNVYFSQDSLTQAIQRVDQENQQLRSQLFTLRQKNAAP